MTFPFNKPDCFYRIDESRLVSTKVAYITKWVNAAVMYYNKFYNTSNASQKKYLSGTLLQVLGVVSFYYRNKEMSFNQYNEFKEKLIVESHIKYHSFLLKLYVNLNQISPIYPRGLKYIIRSLMNINIK
jgi:hypothetical protein